MTLRLSCRLCRARVSSAHTRLSIRRLPKATSSDLAELRGYAYFSVLRFAIYVPGASDALVRGGRYDEVGAVFGRKRPAAGFSLDLKELVAVVPPLALKAAIRLAGTW